MAQGRRQKFVWYVSGPKNKSLNIKFLGGIFLGQPGTQTSGYPGQKLYASGLMSRDLGRDVLDLEKLCARKLWADFSYPNFWIFGCGFQRAETGALDLVGSAVLGRRNFHSKLIDLLVGPFRGAVFRHGGGALKQPMKEPTETPTSILALMGCFPSLMGRFPTLMGRFTDFVLRGRFTS